MAKTYSLDDFASEPEQTFSLADFEGAPAAQTFSLQDFETPAAAPQEQSAEPVGVFDRVRNFLTQPIPLTESEKLIAGSLKKGIKQLGDVPAGILYAELSGLQSAREAQYGKDLEGAPPEVKARHAETAKKLVELQKEATLSGVERKQIEAEFGVNPLAKKLNTLSQSEQYKEADFLGKAKQYSDALVENAGDIPGYIGTLGLESLPSSLATVATAMLTRFLPGGGSKAVAATAAGGTSGFIEFGNNYAELRDQGMGHEEAWEKAAVKSGVIGLFDAVSFGAAGKAANEIVDKVQKGAALAATKQTLKSSTAQGLYGAAGEGGGAAVIGEEVDPIKMGAEFAGEFFTAPIEAVGAYRDYRQAAQTPSPAVPPAEPKAAEAVEPAPPQQEEMITETAPGISVSYPREEPTFMVDPETGEIVPAPETPIESEQNPIIQRRALELRQSSGYPAEVALAVARREFAEGDLNVEPTPTPSERVGDLRAGVDDGRIEPSISVPSEGAAAPAGVESPRVGGLDGDLRPAGEPVSGEEAQRTTLDVRGIMTANTSAQGLAGDAAANAIVAEVDTALKSGTPVTLYADNKPVPIVAINNGMMQDAKGQRWGTLALLTDPEGKLGNKIEFGTPQEAQIPTLTERAPTPVQQAEVALQNAEQAVTAATTPEEKKVATKERNKARQAVKKAKAETPAVETPTAPAAPAIPTALTLSQEDQSRLDTAKQDMVEAQGTLATLAEQGYTSPDQHYGVESAQRKIASAQGVINELEPTAAPTVEAPVTEAPIAEAPVVEAAPAKKRGRPPKPVVEGAAPTAPKKRGRPSLKTELTPEQIAFKEAERQQNQEDLIKASRNVDKLIKIANFVPQETKYKTPEEFQAAQAAAASARKTAIYQLQKFATAPAFRNAKASGGKAAQFLASGQVTPKELADVQARIEFEKTRGPKPSAARRKSQDKPVDAYYGFTRASQAIDYIMRNGTPFERALAGRLKPFVTDVRLAIADNQEETPDAIKDLIGDAAGVYSSAQFKDKIHRMIVLRGESFDDPANHGVNNIIFLHEALHAATEAKIDEWQELTSLGMDVPKQLQTLINDLFYVMDAAQQHYEALKASGAPISDNLRHKFEKLEIGSDPKEFVAYGMTDPDVQQFLLQAPGTARKDSALGYVKDLFSGFVSAIRRAFNMDAKHQSAMQDLMLVTEGLLREQEIEPAYSINTVLNAKTKQVDKNLEKVRLSPDAESIVKPVEQNVADGHTYNDFNDLLKARLDAMGNGFISKTLATLQTADIIRWQGDAIPALKSIDTLVERMAGSRLNMERAFARKADKFAAFIRKAGKKKILLSNAMHLARLNSVSPTMYKDRADALATDKRIVQLDKLLADPTTPQEERPSIAAKRTIRQDQINQTFDAWEQLGTLKGGQDMYRTVRQFYKDANVLIRTLLDERIERLNIEGKIDDPSTPKGKLMLAVRRMQEGSDFRGIDEYFPFMRYGNYWLRVNGPQGREFYLFENGTERNAWLTKRARELGVDPNTDTETFDAGDDLAALRKKYSPESRMLADMFETIDNETDKPGFDKESLKDALYQTYLMTLPEESYRKQFLHAENVTGFSSDVFRNFTTTANRIASQASKLAYGDKISAEIERARDTLAGMPALKKAKLELFVNEIQSRVDEELDPPIESKAVSRINQFAYYSLLTGVASAITQTTALPMLVMPVLNQQYGYGSAAAKFTKYMAAWRSIGVTQEGADGEVIYTAPSVGSSSMVKNNPLLQRAFQEAIDRGLTTQTNSSVLTNNRRTPANAYEKIPRAFMRATATAMSSLFTGAERMTREVAYMMAFELEYAKTKDFDASVQKAVETVQELLGRYDAFNRPRIMRNVVGRTVGQFKMYAVNITSFFVRNAYNMFAEMFKGNPKAAGAAMHRLTGVLAMAAVFGGVTSFPMYSFVCSAIDLWLDAFGDDEDEERRIANNPYTAKSSDLRFRYEFLPQMFGNIKVTGLDGKERSLASVLEKGVISELGDFNIGSRTSYDGMWFRDAKPGNTTAETVLNYAAANLGPAVSSGLSMTGAVDDFKDGKIARGIERLMPALLKNPMTAARLAKEGAKTPGGEIIMDKDEFSSFNIAMQSLGFQPTTLARYQENKFKLQQETVAATKARSEILSKLDNVVLGSDSSDADFERVFNRIDKFNDRYMALEHLRISPDTIMRVLDKAKDRQRYMFRGMYIRKEDLPYLLELRDAAESRAQ